MNLWSFLETHLCSILTAFFSGTTVTIYYYLTRGRERKNKDER